VPCAGQGNPDKALPLAGQTDHGDVSSSHSAISKKNWQDAFLSNMTFKGADLLYLYIP
jgi:hypothetical protein